MHNEIAPLALKFERELLRDISADDYDAFNRILDQLRDRAGEIE